MRVTPSGSRRSRNDARRHDPGHGAGHNADHDPGHKAGHDERHAAGGLLLAPHPAGGTSAMFDYLWADNRREVDEEDVFVFGEDKPEDLSVTDLEYKVTDALLDTDTGHRFETGGERA